MNDGFYIGGIGLGAQQTALQTLANNIANLNTQGFKRSDIRFEEIMAVEQVGAGELESSSRPTVFGVQADRIFSVAQQGALEQTGNALDIAIQGEGFIELMGPGGESYLWRGGRLRVGPDGFLANENGMMLRALINVPEDASEIRIAQDGRVLAAVHGEDEPIELGGISLVRSPSETEFDRFDGGLYRVERGADLSERLPGEDGMGALVQGSVERSNVDLNREMIQMMVVQRAYASNAQVVQAADQLMAIANNLRQ